MSLPALLITGASGLIGSELALRLAEVKPGWRFYLLTRDPERIPPLLRTSRFTPLQGDIRKPGFGLLSRHLNTLRRSVREIVHCAADTRFDRAIDEVRAVNVGGVENVIEFAAACPLLTRVLHLSTAYIAGRSLGRLPEALVTHHSRFSNTYQQSKYEAEHLISSHAWRVPIAIARLSSVIGNAADGCVRQYNHVHQSLKLFPRTFVPVIPSDPDAWVDFIATDWMADALAWLFHFEFQPGVVWHLCGGESNSFRVDELLADTHRLFALHPRGQLFLPIRAPKLGDLSEYEDYLERMRLQGSVLENELLRVLNYFLPHLGLPQIFENHVTMETLHPSGIVQPPVQQLYAGVVRWCLDTNWGQSS